MGYSICLALLCTVRYAASATQYTLEQFGGIANDSSIGASIANSIAMQSALYVASMDHSEVYLPMTNTYTILRFRAVNITNIVLRIDGTLNANDVPYLWPQGDIHYDYDHPAVLDFINCTNVRLTGYGVVDGNPFAPLVVSS
jgi:hypothetical protein